MNNPIKINFKTEIFSVCVLLLTVIASFYFYNNFPESVPVHWNFAGVADRWSGSMMAAFIIPGVMIFMYVMFLFLPLLDPKKDRYVEFAKTYLMFRNLILAFMAFIYLISSLNGLGYNFPIEIYVPGAVGVLFVVMGKYLPSVKSNWFVGIRTPWTLSSEEVWNKTHKFGGKIFIGAGLLMMIEGILPSEFRLGTFIFIIALMLLGTIGSSYYFYIKEKNSKNK